MRQYLYWALVACFCTTAAAQDAEQAPIAADLSAVGVAADGDRAAPPASDSIPAEPDLLTGSEPVQQLAAPSSAENEIAAGSPIVVSIDATVSSRTAARRDMFPISLVEPIRLGERIIVPAGVAGQGQVVHAARPGFGGRAGELIIAARYLEWQGRRVALRGLRVSSSGRQQVGEAFVATAIIPLAGLVITGTSAEVAAGQIAIARLVEPIRVEGGEDASSASSTEQGTGDVSQDIAEEGEDQ